MGSNNNKYDEEFKANAVKLVVEKGRAISTVAKDLGVSEPAIRRWVMASTEPEDSHATRIAQLFRQTIGPATTPRIMLVQKTSLAA